MILLKIPSRMAIRQNHEKCQNLDIFCTGKSVSEALILKSVNPQYDERLFIEFPETTCCFECQNKNKNKPIFVLTQHVVNLYFSWKLMNNLSSYCGVTDLRMRASDIDLPVYDTKIFR